MQFLNERNTKDMGLITTEIEVRISSANYKYYEALGYKIPRYYNKNHCKWMIKNGITITVKVDDLSPTNHIKIDVECDECHIQKPLTYISYYQGKRDDGKYYCIHCAYKVCFSGENNINWDFNKTPEEREKNVNILNTLNLLSLFWQETIIHVSVAGKNMENWMFII